MEGRVGSVRMGLSLGSRKRVQVSQYRGDKLEGGN